MKNIKSFEDFVNESIEPINELKTFSPANVKEYDINKSSLAALKKWSYKIDDIEIKFVDVEEYWSKGITPYFIQFLKEKVSSAGFVKFTVNGEETGIRIAYNGNNKPGLHAAERPYVGLMEAEINKSDFLRFIGEVEDKIGGFIKLLDYLFKTYEKEIYEFYSGLLNLKTLHVIPVGDIAPATGKTPHGWSIFDQPTSVLGILKNGRYAVISAAGMKIGDKFKLVDDQKRKEIQKEAEIVELIPCNFDSYVKYCKSKGYEIPVGAYQKQPGSGRIYLYSIK